MSTSRRKFLAGAATAAIGTTLAAPAALGATRTDSPLPAPENSGIDHIVVVMMENRSFDHYLGWLPGADGKQAGLRYTDRSGLSHSTYHLQTTQGCGYNDPDHSFEGGRVEYNSGACDGWLRAGQNDVFSIGYYLPEDLAFYGNAAPHWTVCDRYFSAIMAETYPNRFYQHAAQTDRIHNSTTTSTLPTIWGRLAGAGLSGRYYYYDTPFTALWGTKYLPISHPYGDFLADCAAGTLPQVSFVDPKFLDEGTGTSADDHPHADIRAGQTFLSQVYRAVTSSPAWGRTLLVINYDEWGGFYDHVAPAVAPDANPDWGLRGFRVPCLVISPRARRGHVAHDVYDHTSVLKAIEWRWNLAPLTPRDANARNLAEVLDFSNPPSLAAPQWNVPSVVGAPCGVSTPGDYEEWHALHDLAASNGWSLT
ncbi:alkaline phosphatase family protein [Actinacidiphila oryziradicis]|uniref:alkaline phosphatase family protein n=1 Tax=Actinacidiphila oryziradicis TaxID=2571141 RepID=UPI0023F3E5FE|nr:alkaline phosphatase family protein [Actinacidiphila oryziradicis]MCW2868776.1 phospholipase [Actinacidiphila oryziradicis]